MEEYKNEKIDKPKEALPEFAQIGEYYCGLLEDTKEVYRKSQYKDLYVPLHIDALIRLKEEVKNILGGEDFKILGDGRIETKTTKRKIFIHKLKNLNKK